MSVIKAWVLEHKFMLIGIIAGIILAIIIIATYSWVMDAQQYSEYRHRFAVAFGYFITAVLGIVGAAIGHYYDI